MRLEAGQKLLHYRLVEKIGEGGMGVVWQAEDTRLHRLVALKFVPEESAQGAQAVDRHLREARAASSLNHPHICSVYDIGEWDVRRFIVMELLEGQSLQQRIGGKPMEVETAVRSWNRGGGPTCARTVVISATGPKRFRYFGRFTSDSDAARCRRVSEKRLKPYLGVLPVLVSGVLAPGPSVCKAGLRLTGCP